jgi:hypothetical protein
MKTKLIAAVVLILLLSLLTNYYDTANTRKELRSPQITPEADESMSVLTQPSITESLPLSSVGETRRRRSQLDPDSYWDPDRKDPAYRRRVIRHRQISQFMTSSRRDDPAYRDVMKKLLEHGYGLADWIDFVGVASQYHMPVSLARARLHAEGFLPDQIEEELVPARAHQALLRRNITEMIRNVIGIHDDEFLNELLGIELPYTQGDQILGPGAMAMIRGDRLYTEEDWMDAEFQAAAERYEGPPRLPRDPATPAILDSESDSGILPPTEFELLEEQE